MAAGPPHDETMPPHLPRRRPAPPARRPAPHPVAPPSAARPHGPGDVKAPGLAALLRRHPALGRRSAWGAIAAGAALFVIASVTAPLAAAPVAAQSSPPRPTVAGPPVIPALALGSATPARTQPVRTAATRTRRTAPAGHGVISGLAANGIPEVALNAYRVAAARMGNVDPGCGIDWALLAGIGREESDHGQFDGAVLHADGISTPPIIGPALDGVHWDYVPAPPNGLQLDGDAKYAHALGPMQFIPSTWAIYGADANGDGKADVFNINDAALGAARYLCAAGGNLRTHAGQVRAVLAYNHSDQYLAQVLALAEAYRRGIPITGIPVGITSGPLPSITDTGYIPPANPGAPTAAGPAAGTRAKAKRRTTRTSSAPTSATSTSTSPRTSSSSAAGGSSSAPPPSTTGAPSPTPTPSPTPSPSPTCGLLQQIAHQC